MLENRRGHIPTFLFIAVALILAIIVLFTFVSFDSDLIKKSGEIGSVIDGFELEERYVMGIFEDSVEKAKELSEDDEGLRVRFKDIVLERDLNVDFGRDFFDKVRNDKFEVREGKIVLEVEIIHENGNNKIRRLIVLSK